MRFAEDVIKEWESGTKCRWGQWLDKKKKVVQVRKESEEKEVGRKRPWSVLPFLAKYQNAPWQNEQIKS